MEVVLIRFGDQKTGIRKWKNLVCVSLACLPGGTILPIHKGYQVYERENEFHFRYDEDLGNVQGETIRSPGLELRQIWSWSKRFNFQCHSPSPERFTLQKK